MGITTVTYDIHDLAEYINWIYFSMPGDFSHGLQLLPIFTAVMLAVPDGWLPFPKPTAPRQQRLCSCIRKPTAC